MRRLKRKELENGLSDMIIATIGLLKDLHIIHEDTPVKELLEAKLPFGDITVAKLLHNIYKILVPVMMVARRNYPMFFEIFDWCENVIRKLFKK